jgi:macrolide transport system ATP-binding/permease protein
MPLLRRALNLLSRSRLDREIEIELASHIEMRTEDNLAAGMTPKDARRDALLRFGNRTATKERVVNTGAIPLLASIWSDVSYTCRQLVRNPGFALTAILVLALGICASAAIFAFVDAVLITPLPYKNPPRLVGLFESTPLGPRFHLSHLDYLDWKRMNHVFTSVEAFDQNTLALMTATGVQRTEGVSVGAGFFRLLGISPVLGRDFHPGEDVAGAPRTVILTYSAWEKRFGKQQDVLGKTVTLNGASSVIVGVLPQWFQFAPAGAAEFWMPLQSSPKPEERGEHGMLAFARLRDGVSLQVASADMSTIAQQLAKQYPDADEGRGATVVPLTELIVGSLRPTLLLLLSGAALLLLIAAVNVSGLLLVRLQSRQRELAVRAALGATAARLTRQLATEAVVLTLAGTLLGIGAAYGAIQLLRQLIPLDMLDTMPYLKSLGLNAHVLLFAAATGLACALLLSLMAIARAPFSDLQGGLTAGGRGAAGTVWRHLGANMVVMELCTAMVLLVGAGLLCKSFYKLLHTEIGLQPDHLAVLRMWARQSRYSKNEQIIALAHQVMDEVRHLPGVQSVAVAHQIPVANLAGGSVSFEIIGSPQRQENNDANSRQVSSSYFTTVQARLFAGRWFSETDNASRPRVAIVNRVFAQKYFAGEDPLGRSFRFDASQPPIEIVGIVENINEGPPDADVQPALYTPFDQDPDAGFFVVVRTAQTPEVILTALEETIHHISPTILTTGAETMEGRIYHLQSTWLRRSSAWLSGGFAAVALLLGVVGLYGVVAYSVSQRTREIGVRIALGAQRGSVYRLILIEAGRLIAAGIGIGLLSAIGTATLMSKLLFHTQPWDWETLAAVAMVLAISALSATFIPARRAAAVEPTEALRAE